MAKTTQMTSLLKPLISQNPEELLARLDEYGRVKDFWEKARIILAAKPNLIGEVLRKARKLEEQEGKRRLIRQLERAEGLVVSLSKPKQQGTEPTKVRFNPFFQFYQLGETIEPFNNETVTLE